MGLRGAVGTVAVVLVGAGCGGRVLSDGTTRDAGAIVAPIGTDAATATTTGSGGGSVGGTVQLPACRPGFLPYDHPDLPCSYMYDNRCYDTKAAACGCACPNRPGTSCTSGFPQVNGKVAVSCG